MIITAEILLLTLLIGGVWLALTGLIALVSLARQLRAWRQHRAAIYTPPVGALVQVVDRATAPARAASRVHQPRRLIDHGTPVALPVREGRPDQVVIDIRPTDGPTRDQQNIQRLIDYLKGQTLTEETLPAKVS